MCWTRRATPTSSATPTPPCSVCETALFVVDASEGPQPTTVKLWYAAEDLRLARAVFINRIDKENADYDACMKALASASACAWAL